MNEQDKMAALKAVQGQVVQTAREPYFFTLKSHECAQVHFLADLSEHVLLQYHEHYDKARSRYDVQAMCASSYEQVCQLCLDAPADDAPEAISCCYLPVYCHGIQVQANGKWQPVEDRLVRGVRVLEMKIYKKGGSALLDWLTKHYEEVGSLLQTDFLILRGKGTEYSLKSKPAGMIPDDVTVPGADQIKADLVRMRPLQRVPGALSLDEDFDPFA